MLQEKFGIIRYANCWEDTEILLESLKIKKDGVYLSIISGGDNTLGMLVRDPLKITGVDLSPAQIALFKLKIAAFKKLEYNEVLEFFGVLPSKNRIDKYEMLKDDIGDAKYYWDNHKHLVQEGIIFTGKFERYFIIFRKFVLPFIHSRKTIDKMFRLNSKSERIEFFKQDWNNFMWKLMFQIFFGKYLMGNLGRDPEFFKYVTEPVAKSIKMRVDRGIMNIPAKENPYVDFILNGNFKYTLPFYLRKENFDIIKERLDRIEIVLGPVETCLNRKYDGFNISDIFEYMSYEEFKKIYGMILKCAKKGAKIVYRNMLARRECPPEYRKFVISHIEEANNFLINDKAFFYSRILIEEKK